MNNYPEQWNKSRDISFFDLFEKQYNLSQLDLNNCNLLLNDILKSRDYIKKENLQFFDKYTIN